MRFTTRLLASAAMLATSACAVGPAVTDDRGARATTDDSPGRLPTGARLDPASPLHDVGQMPLAMIASPEGDRLVLLLNGWRDEGIQVVERATGKILQTVKLPAAFLGLAFSIDGHTLFASGGNTDVVYAFDWTNGAATLRDSIVLQARATPRANGVRYPSGLAVSPDGRRLYVAENLADSLAVIDLATRRVVQRLETGRYPYAVAVAPNGSVYVSNWGGQHVSVCGRRGGRASPHRPDSRWTSSVRTADEPRAATGCSSRWRASIASYRWISRAAA